LVLQRSVVVHIMGNAALQFAIHGKVSVCT